MKTEYFSIVLRGFWLQCFKVSSNCLICPHWTESFIAFSNFAGNKDGKTALDIAKDLGNPESIELVTKCFDVFNFYNFTDISVIWQFKMFQIWK